MGNIVVSEALRLEAISPNPTKLVHTYVASQAALPAEAFDPTTSTPGFLDAYSDFGMSRPQLPYFGSDGAAAGRLVNFFNPTDYALTDWKVWPMNNSTKPDSGYVEGPARVYSRSSFGGLVSRTLDLSFARDRYEAFAFAAQAHSKTLGAQSGVSGPFTTSAQVDLSALSRLIAAPPAGVDLTHDQYDHSGEFNGTNMLRKYYWNLLMKTFGFTPIDPSQTSPPVLP